MSIRVLGPLEVDGGQGLRPRDRAVLAALLVRRGRPVLPAEIAQAVWGEDPPVSWSKQVQICIVRLRKALSHNVIQTSRDGGYRLAVELVTVDADRLEELIARGRGFLAIGEPDRAATALARALALIRGEPFRAIERWPPAATEAERLTEVIRSAEDDLLDARLVLGQHREVVGEAGALVGQDPLRERRWSMLALAQYRCGRQADALESVHRARVLLREQLGIDPGAELLDLEQRILHHDASLDEIAEPRPVSTACPYKGLAPLGAGDQLYGRDADVAELLGRSGMSGLLVIAGPSGSGKSSLVRAGVVPALEQQGRACRVVVPDPTGEIDVPDGSEPSTVLVIDQFEHAFLGDRPADMMRSDLSALARYATSHLVIVVVRADQLAALGIAPAIGRLAEENLHFVTAPIGAALREAIERPALEAGLRVEPGLVDLVMRDTEGERGALPMMSHALAETWQRRDGNVLTVEAYRASGGIRGAVARTADRVYESLAEPQRRAVRSVLLRLVVPSIDGLPMRSRVARGSLGKNPEWEEVVSRLIAARLLTAEDGALEISHEALARAWPRLRSWLDEDAGGLRLLRHLSAAAEGWESLGRPDSELYRGARLQAAQEYLEVASPDLTVVERDFIDTSTSRSVAEGDAMREQARRESRQNRRLRILLAAFACLLLVTMGAVVVAQQQGVDARHQAEEATIEAIVNRSLALRGTDRDIAALLAVEAYRRWPNDPRVTSALLGTFTTGTGVVGNYYVDDAATLRGAMIPGATRAVVALDGMHPLVMDVGTGQVVETLDIPEGHGAAGGFGVAVSGDARRAAVLLAVPHGECGNDGGITEGGTCGAFVVYDLDTGRTIAGPVATPDGPGGIALSPDGTSVGVVGDGSGVAMLYDLAKERTVGILPGLAVPSSGEGWGSGATAVTFGQDGLMYVGSAAGPIRAIRPDTGELVASLDASPGYSNRHLAVGSDGVLVAGGTAGLVAFEVSSARPSWSIDFGGTSPDPCPWFTASVATERLYCGSYYGEIEERDRLTGQRTGLVLDTQLGSVGDLAVTPDGTELTVFGAESPAITRWRLDGSGPVSTRIADGYAAMDRFGYDNDALLVARRPAEATTSDDFDDYALWDVTENRMLDDIPPDQRDGLEGIGWVGRSLILGMDVSAQQFRWYDTDRRSLVEGPRIGVECEHLWPSADGTRAYCGGADGLVQTIDAVNRALIDPTMQVDGRIWSVSATRRGERVVVSSVTERGFETVVFDATARVLAGPISGPLLMSVSLDGTLMGTAAGAITRYDLNTLEPLGELAGASGEVNSLQFSDDGSLLLATSNDQTASLYDVATGLRLGDPISTSAPLIYPAFIKPDGSALVITDATGIVRWELEPERLATAACRVAGRDLTPTEWATYLAGLGEHRATCRDELRPAK